MNEDQRSRNERIAAAARELYNAPPPTPRDEMWAEVEARLEGAPPSHGTGSGDSAATHRGIGRAAWWMGIAAALLIGLGIGRLSIRTDVGDTRIAGDAATPDQVVVAPGGGADEAAGSADDELPTRPAAPPAAGGDPRTERPAEPAPTVAGNGRPTGRSLPYVVATREHLSRSETFLAGIRANPEFESADSELENWARSLLTRTRVLMASPAGRDPETRRLLEDLELMLAQIVVTAATRDPGEARIVGENIEGSGLLYRLRSAAEENIGPGDVRASNTSSL